MTEKNLCTVTGNLIVPEEVFTPGGAEKLLEPLRKKLKEFVPDITTSKGRNEIKSFAAKYSTSKTLVDKLGKGLKDEYKVLIDPIDRERKIFRDECDKMRDKARQPLTDWEAEQERLIEEERLKKEIESAWDLALTEDDIFTRERELKRKEEAQAKIEAEKLAKEKAEEEEKARIEYEAELKAEAEARVKKEAEEALLKEQQEKERLIQEAKQREEQVRIDTANAEKKRLQDIEDAKIKAAKDKMIAMNRMKEEQEAKEKAEADRLAEEKRIADRKAANMNHRKAVNNRVLKKLMDLDLLEEHAKRIIEDLLKNPIPEISINY